MIGKLSKEMKKHCLDNALENEIIVIPNSHDSGLDEYMETKLGKVYECLKTRKRIGECHLELTYPDEKSSFYEFSVFKEAPDNKAKDRRFCGLFSVNVSSYINSAFSERYEDLLVYTKDQLKDTTVLLVVSTDMPEKARGLVTKAMKEGFVVTELPLPSAERVFEYLKETSGKAEAVDSRRAEVMGAIEGNGFEIVGEITKALESRTKLVSKKNGHESKSRFGY